MTTALPSLLEQHPEWSLVLAAYSAAEQLLPPRSKRPAVPTGGIPLETEAQVAPVAVQDDDARWIPRIGEIEGIAAELLPRAHGRLIAEGLLRFNLLGRNDGIGYRLTPAGRQALGIAVQENAEEVEESEAA